MHRSTRRLRAYFHYLKKPFAEFFPFLVLLAALLLAGTLAFHRLYRPDVLGLRHAFYITWCLLFGEHLLPFPSHGLLQAFYLLLPPLGFLVFLDGVVRFSYHLLKRDETSKDWVVAMSKTLRNHVILCGLGKNGFRILQKLIDLEAQVAVLEKDPQCPNLDFARSRGIPVLVGNGREERVFEELNIKEARSIILATNDDLANLEMALDARRLKPGIRVVMRMYDQELASKIREGFDIHLAFSSSELAAPLFATSSMDRSIVNAFYVDGRLLVVARLEVQEDSALREMRLSELGSKHRLNVLSHARGGRVEVYPDASTELRAGDGVTVQTEPAVLRKLHVLNRDREPY